MVNLRKAAADSVVTEIWAHLHFHKTNNFIILRLLQKKNYTN